jgi:hypothetical protein
MLRIAFLLAAITTSGCVVHRHHHHPRHQKVVVVKEKRCHPSQYWDGNECRHKGKGHGARKHDGR